MGSFYNTTVFIDLPTFVVVVTGKTLNNIISTRLKNKQVD